MPKPLLPPNLSASTLNIAVSYTMVALTLMMHAELIVFAIDFVRKLNPWRLRVN